MEKRLRKRNGTMVSAVLNCKMFIFKIRRACLRMKDTASYECGSVGVGISLHQHKLTLTPLRAAILLLFVFSLFNVVRSATQITGTVLDADSKAPLKNALVSLKSTGDLGLTDEFGKFSISPTSVINHNVMRRENTNAIRLKNGLLSLYVEKQNSKIELKTYTLTGKQINSFSYTLSVGTHSIAISNLCSAAGTILCKLKINTQVYTFPLTPTLSHTISPMFRQSAISTSAHEHAVSIVDTLIVSKYLYTTTTSSVTATIYLKKPSTPPPPPGMKAISGGTFMMGSTGPFHEQDEIPVHQVTVSPFFIDSTEVTQADYKLLMGVEPWVDYKATYAAEYPGAMKKFPVWYMTWNDAVLYCNERSKRDGLDTIYSYKKLSGIFGSNSILDSVELNYNKNGYRLPTEAEWEYVARAGTTTEFYWGDKYDSTAFKYTRFKSSSAIYGPIKVASLIPNQFGLYDIIGNVYEFVNDYLGIYSDSAVINPTGPKSGSRLDGYARAIRGGSWRINIHNCRVARRFGAIPDKREPEIAMGFRVVLPNK